MDVYDFQLEYVLAGQTENPEKFARENYSKKILLLYCTVWAGAYSGPSLEGHGHTTVQPRPVTQLE